MLFYFEYQQNLLKEYEENSLISNEEVLFSAGQRQKSSTIYTKKQVPGFIPSKSKDPKVLLMQSQEPFEQTRKFFHKFMKMPPMATLTSTKAMSYMFTQKVMDKRFNPK